MLVVRGPSYHMPSRNTIKEFAAEEFYHVYNRGVEKRVIFLDDQDYTVFLGILKKYLTGERANDINRHQFNNLAHELDLLAYCLMPNHFHLLFYQHTPDAITKMMRRLMTSYAMYFNNRYNRVGTLFQGRYKASHINADSYLHHISRYIHLNPEDHANWPYSSYKNYLGKKKAGWVKTRAILDLFDGDAKQYTQFVEDYIDNRAEISAIKWQLADDLDD